MWSSILILLTASKTFSETITSSAGITYSGTSYKGTLRNVKRKFLPSAYLSEPKVIIN